MGISPFFLMEINPVVLVDIDHFECRPGIYIGPKVLISADRYVVIYGLRE